MDQIHRQQKTVETSVPQTVPTCTTLLSKAHYIYDLKTIGVPARYNRGAGGLFAALQPPPPLVAPPQS
eukprot:COSAG06_NODE_28844_length_567_cov_0.476496_1_plen_67_part_01